MVRPYPWPASRGSSRATAGSEPSRERLGAAGERRAKRRSSVARLPLDALPAASVRSRGRGSPISERDRERFDLARLERAIATLSDAHRRVRDENAALRRKIEERSRRVRALEERLIEANQQRQDVAKRVDELIAQLDHLDAQLDNAAEE